MAGRHHETFLATSIYRVHHSTGPFNSVLINRYRNGRDYIGWHRDDDYGLAEPTIPGLTLGATRRFLLRHKQTKETVEYAPVHGSLIVMRRHTNADWVHSVPKQLRVKEERLNLTFRRMGGSQ
jgi:alkylated DNA repair dioxygenase AlkB